jgi:hypothetical protein
MYGLRNFENVLRAGVEKGHSDHFSPVNDARRQTGQAKSYDSEGPLVWFFGADSAEILT